MYYFFMHIHAQRTIVISCKVGSIWISFLVRLTADIVIYIFMMQMYIVLQSDVVLS